MFVFNEAKFREILLLDDGRSISRNVASLNTYVHDVINLLKSVRIRSYSGPYFPAFGLNTERYSVSLRIQSECGKIRTRITPNTDTFHAVLNICGDPGHVSTYHLQNL